MRHMMMGLMVLTLCALQAPKVYACTCSSPRPISDAFFGADLIFAGKVMQVDTVMTQFIPWPIRRVRFQVQRRWKGSDSTEVEVFTGFSGADCGYWFEEGEEYLVYAGLDQDVFFTSLCSRNRLLRFAQADIDLLDGLIACSCFPPGPPTQERDAADLVFLGSVVQIDTVMINIGTNTLHPALNVVFRVDRFWKGVNSAEVEIVTATNCAECGVHFEEGERYLVYAAFYSGLSKPETNLCTRTRAFSQAADDVAALGDGTPVLVPVPGPTLVKTETEEPPAAFSLAQNYPNPFNPATEIGYVLQQPAFVALHVYDLRGRRLRTLVNSFQSAGAYSVTFEAGALPSGAYLYELIAGKGLERKLMMLAR